MTFAQWFATEGFKLQNSPYDMARAAWEHAESSYVNDSVSVPRSLAERTEAMFRSVDPEGGIAQEWKQALSPISPCSEKS